LLENIHRGIAAAAPRLCVGDKDADYWRVFPGRWFKKAAHDVLHGLAAALQTSLQISKEVPVYTLR